MGGALPRPGASILGVLVLSAVILATPAGRRPFWSSDEARFALLAQDALDHGRWLVAERRARRRRRRGGVHGGTRRASQAPPAARNRSGLRCGRDRVVGAVPGLVAGQLRRSGPRRSLPDVVRARGHPASAHGALRAVGVVPPLDPARRRGAGRGA